MAIFEPIPDPELSDEPDARGEANEGPASVPSGSLHSTLDDALAHAGSAARRDPNAANFPWRSLGPRNVGGRTRCLIQDPLDARILYAGTPRGLWKTINAGDTWSVLEDFRPPNPPDNVPQALPVGALGIGRSNTQVLYVGTGEPVLNKFDYDYKLSGAGLYWSTNGGQTLTRLDHSDTGTIASRNFERIIVDPWEPRRLWIASPLKGLWRGSPTGAFPNPPVFAQDVVDGAAAPAAADQDASDVAVDFGNPAGVPPAKYTIYLALRGRGIFTATFDRASNAYDTDASGVAWRQITSNKFPKADADVNKREFHRLKIAVCAEHPRNVYAIFALKDNKASNVFHSADAGANWEETSSRPGDDSEQAWYDLVLEVHPKDPKVIFTGNVDMYRSYDGGRHWDKVIDWLQYNRGDRAQHADQHALLFDHSDIRKVWVGNDGGISMTGDLGHNWRKRSHGILAAQPNDITTHPSFPMVWGGGLQDNGTWVSYGGLTWHYMYGGDGGDIGFEPTDVRAFHVTTQNGVSQARVQETEDFNWLYSNPIPDVGADQQMRVEILDRGSGFSGSHKSTFYAVLEHHPGNANEALIGRYKALYRTTDGHDWDDQNLGDLAEFRPAGNDSAFYNAQISAIAYGPAGSANAVWWAATSRGEVYLTTNGGTDWNAVGPAAANGNWIAQLAVHPVNPNIVAFCCAKQDGEVYISGDQGANWLEISGLDANATAVAASRLGPSPALALAFDPGCPNGAAGPHTLYVGTLSGVYVIRNAVAPTAAPGGVIFNPVWRTLNVGLPLVQIYDLEATRYTGGNGILKDTLRAATFGRGVYECDLRGAPATRLLVRNHVCDTGLTYQNAQRLVDDPRVPAGRTLEDQQHLSIDIRIDLAPFKDYGVMDAVEMDEEFVTEANLRAGEINLVHVQVQNTGGGDAAATAVHLFFADTTGTPARAPDFAAGAWGAFPAATAPWRLAGTRNLPHLQSSTPQVLTFRWDVPPDVGNEVALLVICSHANDNILTQDAEFQNRPAANPIPPLVIDPRKPNSLVEQDRRAALRIVSMEIYNPDAFVRDGLDDRGLGAVAWSGRSADIVVLEQSTVAGIGDLNTALTDLSDKRLDDHLVNGSNYQIFVRVHNRRRIAFANARVRLFAIALENLTNPNNWVDLGSNNIASIDPQSWRFSAAFNWNTPPDPGGTLERKFWLLAAIVGIDDPAGPDDLAPDHTTINSVQSFWEFFLDTDKANNTAFRVVPWSQ